MSGKMGAAVGACTSATNYKDVREAAGPGRESVAIKNAGCAIPCVVRRRLSEFCHSSADTARTRPSTYASYPSAPVPVILGHLRHPVSVASDSRRSNSP